MGFFDNMRKKKEAKRLGLDLNHYEQYLSVQSTGISVEEFKRYHAVFSSQYSLEQFLQYLRLEKLKFSPRQIHRFLKELSGELLEADYALFLEAEALGLNLSQFLTYQATLSDKMSIPEYVQFQSAQTQGMTVEQYLNYLDQYMGKMTLDQYAQFLKSQPFGLSGERYAQYITLFQQEEEQRRYQDFLTARSLGITLEEYYLRIETTNQNMSTDSCQEYPKAGEAAKVPPVLSAVSSEKVQAKSEGSETAVPPEPPATITPFAPSAIPSEEAQAENEEPKVVVPPDQPATDTPSEALSIPSEEAQIENKKTKMDASPSQPVTDTISVPRVIPFEEELAEEEKTATPVSRIVYWVDTLAIEVPETFLTSTDPAVIGPNRALVAVSDSEMAKLDSPYCADQSMTILFGPDISDIAESDAISDRLGLVNPKICIDTPELNVRYAFRERDESLSIFAGLISTVCKTYPFQFFLREESEEENTALIERILKSISISGQLNSTPRKVSATQTIPKEKHIRVWKAETDEIKKSSIPCPPGQEPAQLKEKVERFLAKLEVAYPDKTVVYLHRDHKKLGERLTYLYRELGYIILLILYIIKNTLQIKTMKMIVYSLI